MPTVNPPRFDGLNRITAANNSCAVVVNGGAPVTPAAIAVGDYFIENIPGDADQLLARFSTMINSVAGVTAAVTIDRTTGRIRITNNHALNTLRINWTQTGLRDLLGFGIPNSATPANTTTLAANGGAEQGAYTHYNAWYPDVPPADLLGDPELGGVLYADAVVTTSPSGAVTTTKFFELTVQRFRFEYLSAAQAVPTSATTTSYEQWWQRVGSAGVRFRYFPDRALLTGFFTYVVDKAGAAAGSKDALGRSVDRYSGYYNLDLPVRRYVAGT